MDEQGQQGAAAEERERASKSDIQKLENRIKEVETQVLTLATFMSRITGIMVDMTKVHAETAEIIKKTLPNK